MHGDPGELSRCLKCEDRNPTVHITLKTTSGFVSIDLCDQCRDLATELEIAPPKNQVCCPRCGRSLQDIAVDGRLGCANDYLIFADHIAKGLEQYHGSAKHVGKIPESEKEEYF